MNDAIFISILISGIIRIFTLLNTLADRYKDHYKLFYEQIITPLPAILKGTKEAAILEARHYMQDKCKDQLKSLGWKYKLFNRFPYYEIGVWFLIILISVLFKFNVL